jgi:DNA-binding ferritin-like protein
MEVWKEKSKLEKNPIGISSGVASLMVPKLDAHLASLFIQFHQYQKHHWLVEGPQFRDLHLFFQEAYDEVHKAADKVAERITALGGIPTSNPVDQAEIAYIEHEPEGAFRVRDMMKRDLENEGEIAIQLRDTIESARELGDPGTAHLLTDILIEVEDRAHHIDHFLGEDTLESQWAERGKVGVGG